MDGAVTTYRPDGWPLCPTCGEDELMSTLPPTMNRRDRGGRVIGFMTRQPQVTDPMRCLRCQWEGWVPARGSA